LELTSHLLNLPGATGLKLDPAGVEWKVEKLAFLAFESPWPAYTGADKRVAGLLSELARAYPIDLWLMPRVPLSPEQKQILAQYTQNVRQVPRRDISLRDKLAVAIKAIKSHLPYHASVVEHSLAMNKQLCESRPQANDWVYANLLHWTGPLKTTTGSRWILDQQNADVQFWDTYAQYSHNPFIKFVAWVNRNLTKHLCSQVYPNTGRIIAVCEEDKELTHQISATASIEVIPNGIDCDYFSPNRSELPTSKLLFTGTSAIRNMKALQFFVQKVYPFVQTAVPEVQFIVGGNFSQAAQNQFVGISGLHFTGKVPDLRPIYNQCSVFVNPFDESHGSKLKVAEALAMGICIVSLPAGIRGMPVVDGESVLLARDASDMARQIIHGLSDPSLANRIGSKGRKVAEMHLDWRRVLGPRLRSIVAQMGPS
jgi:glycosyltransferase involved in cell wall biosynthesis